MHLDKKITGFRANVFEEGGAGNITLIIPGYSPVNVCLCVSSAADGRQFPSKPLRESQSRLLTSTPSWSESDSAANKDKKGKIMISSL